MTFVVFEPTQADEHSWINVIQYFKRENLSPPSFARHASWNNTMSGGNLNGARIDTRVKEMRTMANIYSQYCLYCL